MEAILENLSDLEDLDSWGIGVQITREIACAVSEESLKNPKRWILDCGTTSHICNDRNLLSTYSAERKLFSVPGNNSYSCGVGEIKLKVHNKVTNRYDVVVLTGVSHLLNAPNLISTGKLNKIDLHVNTVDNELFRIKNNMHKYNIKSVPSYAETDHLISNQELHISNTAISQFGHTGMLNHTNSDEQVSNEEYQFDIKLSPELFKALNQKYGPFEMELFASDTNHFLDQ